MPTDVTYDEYLDGVCEMVRLQLWYLRHHLAGHPEETFAQTLHERTDIYRQTDLWDSRPVKQIDFAEPRWAALEERLRRTYDETRGDTDSQRFERDGLALLLPHLAGRVRTLEADGFRTVPKRSQCGSLRYDPPKPETPRRILLHIGNAVRPQSIFDDPAYLPECLECIMRKSEAEFAADSLTTTTWLNSYPPWLTLFPREWVANMGPPKSEVGVGMGYWGQFINARGTFNHKHARLFRETGRLPFLPRPSWCTFAALRAHLADYLHRLP